MIDFYGAGGLNVTKIFIALEEMELAYTAKVVDVTNSANFDPEFIALSPTGKIPVIVDRDAIGGASHTVFESGAILLYLAEKTGRFLPGEALARSEAIQWLMMQMANVGPYFGQLVHFRFYAPEVTYAHDRYKTMVRNTLDVIEGRLGQSPFIGGAEYGIADMAFLPFIRSIDFWLGEESGAAYPDIRAWTAKLIARPAVAKGLALAEEQQGRLPPMSDLRPEVLDRLLGRGAYNRA